MNGRLFFLLLLALVGVSLLTACGSTSAVMPAGQGTFIISARAAPARGGATGAYTMAFEKATEHCARLNKTPEVLSINERDIYQSMDLGFRSRHGREGGSFHERSSAGGGTAASGAINLWFTCIDR